MIHRLDLANGDDDSAASRSSSCLERARRRHRRGRALVCCATTARLRRFTFTALVVGLVLLMLPLVPGIGRTVNGSRIWIGLGPFTFQPGELAKIVLAVFFAGYLVQTRDALSLAGRKVLGLTLPRGRDLGPILVAWALSLGVLVFETDLGSSLLFFGLFVAMLYVATERVSWIAIGLSLFCAGAYVAWLLFDHVQARVHAVARPVRPGRQSDQMVKGLIGMATGGCWAPVWAAGARPRLLRRVRLHRPQLGEELGLAGLFAILVLYVLLVERGMRTAIGVRDGFGKLLASGLAFSVALQCFVVVGGVTRVIPLTGLTMPFLSYGGSSLLANWFLVAHPAADQRPGPPTRRASCPTASRRERGQDRAGGAAVNAPIRRLPVVVACCSAPCWSPSTWIQYVQAEELRGRPDNRRTLLANYARERGPILVGGDPIAEVHGRPRTSSSGCAPTRRATCTPTSPVSSPSPTVPAVESRAPRTRCCPGRRTSSSTAASPTCSPARPRPGPASSSPSTPSPRRPPTTRSATSAEPSWRSTRRPARSWRWSASRRTTPPC